MDDGLAVRIVERLTDRQRIALDAVLAGVLAATSVPVASRDLHITEPRGLAVTLLSYVAVAGACASLPGRRRYPRAVLGIMVAADAVLIGLGIRLPALLAVGFAMYSLAATSGSVLPYWVVIATIVSMAAPGLAAWDGQAVFAAILASGSLLVGWLAGENSRARHTFALALAERAAEREREHARRTAIEERARIARELHDVVAHAMSVIAVRSAVARRIGTSQPARANEALEIIDTISRQSLAELRRIVAVLRESDENSAAALGPPPGLVDLPELLTQIAAAGVQVEMILQGEARPLQPAEELSAYRIAQEALTNVVRHSGADTATLWIRYGSTAVEIECIDLGGDRQRQSGAELVNGGHGIVGMRERVGLYGGELSAGPTDRGYRVLARIPVQDKAG